MNDSHPIDPNARPAVPASAGEYMPKPWIPRPWESAQADWAAIQKAQERRSYKPNPRRQAAGRNNRKKRKGLTEPGRQRLRESTIKHQPWKMSTGPKTVMGRRRSANNGRHSQKGEASIRQLKAELRASVDCGDELRAIRQMLSSGLRSLGAK